MKNKRYDLSNDGTFIGSATLAPEHACLESFIRALEKVLRNGMRLASVFSDDGQYLPWYVD